jgi:cytosine/adenosine deaminase-related metal-dependent hydrolase
VQSGLHTTGGDEAPVLRPLDWLTMASLNGARALGLDAVIGSLEPGKEADFIAVDAGLTAPIHGQETNDPADLMSRLIYRGRPDMVQAAWVRGRLLPA